MTSEQYFALRNELIRSVNFKEMECSLFAAVGLIFMAIGAIPNFPNGGLLSAVGALVTIAMVCLLFVLRRSKNERLDRLRMEYSLGIPFEYVATKLHLLEEKIKEEKFTPGAFESIWKEICFL